MKNLKKIGIWMDHASAHLMEFSNSPIITKVITSKFTHQQKEHSVSKSENLMHNKEQHQNSEYYHELINVIKNFSDIILFGPTNAKNELHNLLKKDHNCSNLKIEVKQADKMSENQEHAFVKDYFSNKLI